ncbi:MAG: glycosyltransferase [Patescibacteria group bacterium]|nr:glycosyltransferase [Patescibacteria group bacterium]MDD4611078.1 glycosyltransferase [Patescibacteria group bacterium]
MKILMLSSDNSIFRNNSMGDFLSRHIAYAEGCERLIIVIKSPTGLGAEINKDNLTLIPSGGKNKFGLFWQIYKQSSIAIKKYQINLINSQDPMIFGLLGWLLKNKYKLPLVVNWHGDFLDNKSWLGESFSNRFFLSLAKFVTRRADHVRVVSPKIKEKLIELGIEESKISVIPTPVDLNKFVQYDEKKLFNLRKKYENKKVILFVGRLVKLKNLDFLLAIFNELLKSRQGYYLLVIGDGEERKNWEKLCRDLSLSQSVEFLGAIQHDLLPEYYHLAEVVIFPSKHESLGKVIIEAAMAGTPTLASKTTGALSIIKDDNLLFSIESEEECLKKINKLLEDDIFRKKVAAQLKNDIEQKFSWSGSVSSIICMWKKILNKN